MDRWHPHYHYKHYLGPVKRLPTGRWIRLPKERWRRMRRRHPEVTAYEPTVLDTLGRPDHILVGDAGTRVAVLRLTRGAFVDRHLVVVFREEGELEAEIVTAYITRAYELDREGLW